MKAGKSLEQLAAEITRRSNAKRDMVARTPGIVMHAGSVEGVRLAVGDMDYGVKTIAHDQIGTHTQIPAKYYDRMLAEAPDLLATNVNAWFNKYPATRMVRTLDGAARAFLSDSYRPLENEDLAEAVLPVIGDLGLDVMSAEITDRRLYIKAVDPKISRELEAKGGKFGDGKHVIVRCLFPAITISNSEVGQGSVSVLGGVYDGGCSNLATFGERSMRKYHVGKKHELGGEDVYAMLSDTTRQLTDKALWAQVRDIVRAAFDRAKFDALCNTIAETQNEVIEGDVVKVVDLTSKRFNINETEGKSVLKHLIEGGDLSRFGVYNAITRAAQDVESYDRATELERTGAMVIELPRQEWRELAMAA